MFKLLPLLLTCIACCVASPEPDGRYNLIIGSSSRGSIRSSLSKPYQSISLTGKSHQRPQILQTNSVTSGEDEDNSSHNNSNNNVIDDNEPIASVSVRPTTTHSPTAGSIASAPASITRLTAAASSGSSAASASTSRFSLRVSSSFNLPASSSSSTTIQHHFLPAETIPLPITISTRPGLRTVIAPETITVHEPTVVKVGELVQKIPTAVSHQSQTVVHKHASVVTPIIAPAVRTITSKVLRAYHTPLIFAPQTTVVRSSAGTGTDTDRGTAKTKGNIINAKALAKASSDGSASASASTSIITNANNGENISTNNNNNKKYKY